MLDKILKDNQALIAQVPRTYNLFFEGHHGASDDLYWKDEIVMKKGPETNCVSVTTELILRTIKDLGFEDGFESEDIKEFLRCAFVYDNDAQRWGIVQAMMEFGIGEEQTVDDIGKVPGIFAQLWHINKNLRDGVGRYKSHYLGHSVYCLETIQKDKKYVRNFSATRDLNGPGVSDLLFERKFSSGHERTWRFCSLKVEV